MTAVGAPPGFNLLRYLHESNRFTLYAGDANPWSGGLYFYQNDGVQPIVLPSANDEEAYIEELLLLAKKYEINAILSGIENEIVVLSKFRGRLESAGVNILLPDHAVLTKARSKTESTEVAKNQGFKAPKSLMGLDSEKTSKDELLNSLNEFKMEVPFPWIMKPTCGHGMHGVLKVEGLEEAVNVFSNYNGEIIIQEFIPGKVGSMYMVGLLYDENGECVREFSSHSVKTLFPEGGPATAGVSKRIQSIIDKSKEILSEIGTWRGPAGIEWMLDPRDGEFKFIEINPRVWGYSSLASGAGSNIHEALGMLSTGMAIEKDQGFKEGVFMIRAPFDVILNEVPVSLRKSLLEN